MTLRLALAAAAMLAAPAAMAADPSPPPAGGETVARAETSPRGTLPRRPERKTPGTPNRPRIVDAPGAALMMIPAAWDPDQAPPAFR